MMLSRRSVREPSTATRPASAARRLLSTGLALLGSLGATVAIAHATGVSPGEKAAHKSVGRASWSSSTARVDKVSHRAAPVRRAPHGLAGVQGPSGAEGTGGGEGPTGLTGPPGPPGIVNQDISINWQNGDYRGQDSASFVAPGIGRGEVVCALNTQWVNFTPYDQSSDSEMWGAIMRGEEVSVRAAARRAPPWGNEFNLGLNMVNGTEPESQGSMVGIISSRGKFGSPGEAGPPPTTFHLSWYWSFADPYGPRCYVAGTFETGR
jgi:hypothetical protein